MTTLCFYQGLTTIGGTIVEIQTDAARCLFDFGTVFSPQADARIRQRQDMAVYDGLKTGTLAGIDGLYDQHELHGYPLKAYGETQPLPIVLISHMHIDHMGELGRLSNDVQVVMTKDSLRLYRGLIKIGNVTSRPHRKLRGVAPMRWQQSGDIRFRLIPVDHDVPGACGFEIVTPDGRICYTGDLRLHGREGEKTLAFADAVKGCDVCITEGTTVSFIENFEALQADAGLEGTVTEAQAETEIAEAAEDTSGLVFLCQYNRNIARIRALQTALPKAGRRFVLQYKTAVLYRQFDADTPLDVYMPSMRRRMVKNAELISTQQIQASPGDYVLELPFEHLLDTLDFQAEGSLFIHSNGVPLGAYDPGYQKLMDFLAQQNIPYCAIGSGGHAAPAHLKYLLERIAPKTLVPLHSLTPDKMKISGAKRLLPEAGKRYVLSMGTLTEEK